MPHVKLQKSATSFNIPPPNVLQCESCKDREFQQKSKDSSFRMALSPIEGCFSLKCTSKTIKLITKPNALKTCHGKYTQA